MKSQFIEKLNIYGLNKIEPIILASLVTETPILLVGQHGSAKSYLLERLSRALNLNYKFYNASLIDYDDLVGIPVPSKDRKTLEYISSKTSIWDAEVVLIDEINRTKPELQNKIFPIIYERRVQGVDLDKLKYRFAAMNPSYEDNGLSYLGTMPLDEALADRFGFIINVPAYQDLSNSDRRKVVEESYKEIDYEGAGIILNELIKKTKEVYLKLKEEAKNYVDDFIYNLIPTLISKFGYISTRRVLTIKDNILSVHAARVVLNRLDNNTQDNKHLASVFEGLNIEDSIYLALPNSMPSKANGVLNEELLFLTTKTILESLSLSLGTKEFVLMTDPIEKTIFGFKHIDEIGHLEFYKSIPQSITNVTKPLRNVFQYCLFKKLQNYVDCPSFIVETTLNDNDALFKLNSISEHSINYRGLKNNSKRINEILNEEVDEHFSKLRSELLNLLISLDDFDINKNLDECYELFTRLYKEFEL